MSTPQDTPHLLAEETIEQLVETFGRQEWFNVTITGPVIIGHSDDRKIATLRWNIHHGIRHHSQMSRTTPLGLNAYFSAVSNVGITGSKDWSSDPGRLRNNDPIRRLDAVQGAAFDKEFFLEVGWKGGWFQSNRCEFDTEITVTGLLITPASEEIELQLNAIASFFKNA